MKISASFLSIKDHLEENIEKLQNTDISFLHLDIMDGIYVENKTEDITTLDVLKNGKKELDVHLMVKDVIHYIDLYAPLRPVYITFHYEAVYNIEPIIHYIKSYHCKVGIALRPDTPITVLEPFYSLIDLVLIMSVEPGKGGQEFLKKTSSKIKKLAEIKKKNNYSFQIEVDGGINDSTCSFTRGADILVIGSYITSALDYQKQVKKIKSELSKLNGKSAKSGKKR